MTEQVQVHATVAIDAPEPSPSPEWRRNWTIDWLRGEREDGGGMDPPWTMSREDIGRLLTVFESSGASPEEAERMTWFLPEAFCRKCLDLGGIHMATETEEDKRSGGHFWVAGPPGALLAELAAEKEVKP